MALVKQTSLTSLPSRKKSLTANKPSQMQRGTSKLKPMNWQVEKAMCLRTLPANASKSYTVKRYGRHYGLPAICRTCVDQGRDGKPPKHLETTAQRRRWIQVHQDLDHIQKTITEQLVERVARRIDMPVLNGVLAN